MFQDTNTPRGILKHETKHSLQITEDYIFLNYWSEICPTSECKK
jgi:hypothetical protein